MTLDRREALRVLGQAAVGTAATAVATTAHAEVGAAKPDDRSLVGMLYDATICTGCQACVTACQEVNGLKGDVEHVGGLWQMPFDLSAKTKNIIKLYHSEDGREYSFVKRQCMHCLEPGCATGCPFNALSKRADGIVAWDPSLCIGCRYCEVSCPFNVPKFEWSSFNPKIVKCELCKERLDIGLKPGCTTVCPTGAVIFGTRFDLLEKAHARIEKDPKRYFEQRVYGEKDGGGTQVLYLSGVPFEHLGLPKLPQESVAAYGTKVHALLYKWLAAPTALYALFAAIIWKRWRDHEHEAQEAKKAGIPEQI
ncbi:hydrogenase 2 operon protein HybA [Myxococcota bacterium]|nr:hydrogenase 2 operon protein HybA [Myxococcota bacterium]